MNLLEDPWILVSTGRGARRVTYAEVMSGEVDADAQIDHPEPWLAASTVMLLAALTQVVLPAETAEDLVDLLARPMPRPRVEEHLRAYVEGASLLGDGPRFMQARAVDDKEDPLASTRLIVERSATYGQTLRARPLRALCGPCMAVAIYGLFAHAPQGGRGYSPSVRGSSPLSTLLDLPSVRASAHANTLPLDWVRAHYPPDVMGAPWNVTARVVKSGDAIGLTEGLFWCPRHVRATALDEGECPLCHLKGPLLGLRSFGPGAKVEGGFYAHPWTPWRLLKGARRAQVVPARPAWTGLPVWLTASQEGGPAPVVDSYVRATGATRVRLRAMGMRFDQTKWLGTVDTRYDVAADAASLDADARRVLCVEGVRAALLGAIRSATPSRGRRADELESNFWRCATEVREESGPSDADFGRRLRRVALDLFDDVVSVDLGHPTRGPAVAAARAALLGAIQKSIRGHHPEEATHGS